MKPSLLVRDVMTIGVPVCCGEERCGQVLARLASAEVLVVLDAEGIACGWLTRRRLERADPERAVETVMDEDIPTVPPDIPAQAAAAIMRDKGVSHVFLMHDWPGARRPSAVLALSTLERLSQGDGRWA